MLSRLRTLLDSPTTIRALTREGEEYRARIARLAYDLTETRGALVVARAECDHLRDELVRVTAEHDAKPVKRAARAVSVERRASVLNTVSDLAMEGADDGTTAVDVAEHMRFVLGWEKPRSTIARWVSDIAAEGWLVSNGRRPARYTLTDKGRASLLVMRSEAMGTGDADPDCDDCGGTGIVAWGPCDCRVRVALARDAMAVAS